MRNNILVVAAHPDDETLGMGATIKKLSAQNDIYVVTFTDGTSSRGVKDPGRMRQFVEAQGLLGVRDWFNHDLPDNRLDSVPLIEIIKPLVSVVHLVKPCTIYTHSLSDLNIDHRRVHEATLVAARPVMSPVRNILSFEVPSATEWGMTTFRPTVFEDVSRSIQDKVRALLCYEDEYRLPPHPRSEAYIRALATYRGYQSGLHMAEAFELIRSVR